MDINNLCCCCLLRPPDKYLKIPYPCLGTTEIYANMIKECFEIQLITSSYGECGICEMCVSRLRDASDFKLQVQRSQAELQARLQGARHVKEEEPEKTQISDDVFGPDCREELTHVSEDMKTEVSDDLLPSDEGEEFKESVIEEDPEKKEISADLGPDCREELIQVSGEMKTEISYDILPSDEDKEFKQFMIDKEKESLESKVEVYEQEPFTGIPRKEHYEQSAESLLAKQKRDDILETCDQDTPRDSEALARHEPGDHKKNPYTCDTCGKQFPSQVGRNRHIARVHQADMEHICKICDKRFKWKSLLDKHNRSHAKVLQCKFCYRTFFDRPSLRTHVRMEHAYSMYYICDECKRVFRKKIHLVTHLNVHTKWRICQCNICALTLSSEASLRRHKLIHTAERAYGCEVCKKRFVIKQALRRHKTIHMGEKNHCCHVCGKKFALSDYLRAHLKIHAEGTSFPCELCPKSYSTKECLRQHKRTHTKEKAVAKPAKKRKNIKIRA